jgi:Tfp pilus assembly protein PilV
MEVIVTFLVLVIGFTGLGLGSIRFGADSREQIPDTHVR